LHEGAYIAIISTNGRVWLCFKNIKYTRSYFSVRHFRLVAGRCTRIHFDVFACVRSG